MGTKRGRGRPPLDPKVRRDRRVTVRLTEDDHARAQARADRDGIDLAELLARAIHRFLRRTRP